MLRAAAAVKQLHFLFLYVAFKSATAYLASAAIFNTDAPPALSTYVGDVMGDIGLLSSRLSEPESENTGNLKIVGNMGLRSV